MFVFRRVIIHRKFLKHISNNIQYVSDIHGDVNEIVPKIQPIAKYLAVCGDLGVPTHPKFEEFFNMYSGQFEKIFFVAGNHDYDCSPLYVEKKKMQYNPMINKIIDKFPNVIFLDRSCYHLHDNIIIAGATLWSRPLTMKYKEHTEEHEKDVKWINEICNSYADKKIVMLTHYVPSFQLIEERYKERGVYATSWFATDLEHMIKKPIVAWVCGHSHSIIEANINGIYCGINAVGHDCKHIFGKVIQIQD
jgi:hypothetical protein